MGSTKTKPHIQKQAAEDKAFWQQHIAAQAVSEISKLAYCRANQVDYARFMYWSKNESLGSLVKPLVAIKLRSATDELSSKTPLCTLVFKSGGCLHVHDARVLTVILDRLN